MVALAVTQEVVKVIAKTESNLVLRACLHGGSVPPANRVTRLTELPWESQLFIRFFRKRIEAFTC